MEAEFDEVRFIFCKSVAECVGTEAGPWSMGAVCPTSYIRMKRRLKYVGTEGRGDVNERASPYTPDLERSCQKRQGNAPLLQPCHTRLGYDQGAPLFVVLHPAIC